MRVLFAFVLWSLCSMPGVQAQTENDIAAVHNIMDYNVENVVRPLDLTGKSPDQVIFSSMFYFYKKYISSQDASHCMFTPSCSEYGLDAIKKKGMIMGLIDGFDRLSRCNGLSRELYHKHPTVNRYYDPVE